MIRAAANWAATWIGCLFIGNAIGYGWVWLSAL
jgi:hypothetical protein